MSDEEIGAMVGVTVQDFYKNAVTVRIFNDHACNIKLYFKHKRL